MSRVEGIFESDGPLAACISGFERRAAQATMASRVERTLENGGVLLAEAGTGTGKTLAYLIPAILSGRRVVVSTGTRNLQEQIFFKDIGFIEEALCIDANAAYLKGQENYLCPRRLDQFLSSPKVLSYRANEVQAISRWAARTTSGDRMELAALADDSSIWHQVCSTRETRIGAKCPFLEGCFVGRARAGANQARLIVVNHHLYFADLATRMQGGAVLPAHDAVVFDEAHLIEDIATEFFSTKVSSARLERLLDDAAAVVKAARFTDDPYEDRRPALLDAAKRDCARFFDAFSGAPQGRTHLASGSLSASSSDAYLRLDSSLEAVWLSLKALEGMDEATDHCAARFTEFRDDLAMVLEHREPGYVHWLEIRNRSTVLGASPIDISQRFREGVLFSTEAVILTSATLSTGGDFSFLRSRLGIDFEAEQISLPAPFDYESQACLYVPDHLPDPRDEEFVDAAAFEILSLVELTCGGALILCTSVRNMRALHARVQEDLARPVLLQGTAPKSALLASFVEDPRAVLVATTSFWQGVDLPGDALRLVVIDKLPFASPQDPVVAARIEHTRAKGGSPFVEYQLPQAALTLKQGFGRLIRTRTDTGLVAILDRRLADRSYARTFFASLPPCPRVASFEEAAHWWRRIRGSSAETDGR